MSKVVGLLGSASGKLGNVVFAVQNGIQTARAYQPNVSNPKSGLQSMQRAKGNLAGRISSFTPRTAIVGLGANNRARRGEFLRTILKAATVTSTASGFVAKVDNNDIIFSRGAVLLSVVNVTATATANVITISLQGVSGDAMSAEDYAKMQTRLVAMVYDLQTQELIEVVTKIATKPGQALTVATLMLTGHPEGYIVDVYAIPMSTGDNTAVSIDTELALRDDDDIAAALSVNANAVVFSYGKSTLVATATYTPA